MDVDAYLARLVGPSFQLTHKSFEMDDMTVEFDENSQCYKIPVTGVVGYYRAQVTKMFKEGGKLHVTVGYIPINSEGDLISTQSDTPTKYMDYLFERTSGSWYLTGLTESATKPEAAASSQQANSVVMMDPDQLQDAILSGVNPGAASSQAASAPAASEQAASSEAASSTAEPAASSEAASSDTAASPAA